jgi:hypothetical protein
VWVRGLRLFGIFGLGLERGFQIWGFLWGKYEVLVVLVED